MKIYQIEITNKCQLRCSYCPRTLHMTRKLGTMSRETIDKIASINTNDSIRLHHYGESLIEPGATTYAIASMKTASPDIIVELNTNGEYLDNDTTQRLFNAGLSKINLSYHHSKSIQHLSSIDPEFRSRIEVMKIAPLDDIEKYREELSRIKTMGYKVVLKKIRDLGQLNAFNKREHDDWKNCSFIKNTEFAVLFDGRIVTCCESYNGDEEEVLGSVYDDVLPTENKKIEKCRTCHGYGNGDIETERIVI